MQHKSTTDVESSVLSPTEAVPDEGLFAEGRTRRAVLAGAGLAGVAGVLAACGDSDGGSTGGSTGVLATKSEIPVGGGKIFSDQKVVVTQPEAGTFKAFSAVCTHRGCTVDSVSGGTINCPCHGSKYKVGDASVAAGPAPAPLETKNITVEGDNIKLA